jgi:prepilin-type N-terminal cleavage/methylation domain-containing protein
MGKGFSFIEIIIVLAIIAILTAGVVISFSGFREINELNKETERMMTLILLARSKTISSEESFQYGIHFATSSVTIFRGTIFSAGDPNNLKTDLSPAVEIFQINLNGGSEAVFQKITGKTENYGTVSLRLKSDFSKTKNINIKSSGMIDVN